MGADGDVLCTVSRIVHFGLFKRASFVAVDDGRAIVHAIAAGHAIQPRPFEVRVRQGQHFRVWYPFWTAIRRGDSLALSKLAPIAGLPRRRLPNPLRRTRLN